MTIGEIVEAVRADLAGKLPSLLEAGGAPDFARYTVGYPDNQDETFCCVGLAAMKGKESVEIIIHLTLPGLSETCSYVYLEGVRKYLDTKFKPSNLGYDTSAWELQVFETELNHGDIQALFSVTMSRELDDCC
ncbi:MAG: hypothetical protein LBT00_08545 [Spirochaetaceae bacterium]|nr:hypothetical protein [Spirochaetaceae bacterium]